MIGSSTDTESGGYRTYMQERLGALDVAVDMVGSLRDRPDRIDLDHEGRRGWTVNQLNGIDAQTIRTHWPDAVLLMAVTYDSARDSSTTIFADLRADHQHYGRRSGHRPVRRLRADGPRRAAAGDSGGACRRLRW
ncbi:hypothetical protein [Sphingomonas lenta]|uniref:SGNH hydrolase-type esterase domain-containing protein n=1 Tax=Sphingomonas lenta TaxID=1141887 RepID=A0A2A2SAW5_9SPHN|nr:hypothetical protein [Sphingomonas lenta]PAX06322.1 hypothetical protein CKY28_17705 [Sphingomonas lenta]